MTVSVLVAGVGNIFLGDDGFGVEVVRNIPSSSFSSEVFVKDFGISSVHLAFELLNGYNYLVLLDAIQTGERPGTLSLIEVDQQDVLANTTSIADAHTMSPTTVLKMLDEFGGRVGRVFVIGCEPKSLEEEIYLSDVVAGAIPGAVEMLHELVSSLLNDQLHKEESK